jgi:hypothetical protein
MLIVEMRHRLQHLGWKVLDGAQADDGTWWLNAQSCGHTIVAHADSRQEVWSLACSMALKLTRNGLAKPL